MAELSGGLFDEIEFEAARTGDHRRAALRMNHLAATAAETGEMSRAEAYMRAGEQWLLADEPANAAEGFRRALADGGPTFADPRASLARALCELGRGAEAAELLRHLEADSAAHGYDPRTCDLVAELLTEQGDMAEALRWATAGVEACRRRGDRVELPLLLRLRYRIRNDLGLPEDDYDRLIGRLSEEPTDRGPHLRPVGRRSRRGRRTVE